MNKQTKMMKPHVFLVIIILFQISCSSSRTITGVDYGSPQVKQELIDDNTFKITRYSQNDTYGYSEENPVMVGGGSDGPKNERRYLNALTGPNGQQILYKRLGSCCPFTTKNSEWGGMLDKYEITYEGLDESMVLYLNMYDSDTLKVPVSLTLKY